MITKYSFLAFLCLASLTCAAETEAPAPKAATFQIHAGPIKRTYQCAPGVETGQIPDGVLHANLRRGDDRYLLISYAIPSRPDSPNKRCGGGVESYLVWLHVRGATLVAMQSALYESCWKDTDGGSVKWSGRYCSVEFERAVYDEAANQGSTVRSKASFDSEAPGKGLQTTDQPPEPLK